MGYLHIYCDNCGGEWEVYHRDISSDKARQCPHCFAKIDKTTWQDGVLPAFEQVEATTARLGMDHANHLPMFTIDYMDNAIYKNAKGVLHDV